MWFEQARDKNFRFERGDCQQARYSVAEDKNDTIYVLNSQYRDDETGFDTASGVAKCNGAQCRVKFSRFMPEGDYRVVYTDYSNYSIVYSCMDILGVAKCESVWILSRDEELAKDKFKEALNTISDRLPDYELSNLYETK